MVTRRTVQLGSQVTNHSVGRHLRAVTRKLRASSRIGFLLGISCLTLAACGLPSGTGNLGAAGPGHLVPVGGLAGITCRSPSNCTAVGSGASTLVEHWNGSAWSLVKSPAPPGTVVWNLESVVCPSNSSCWAVGDTGVAATDHTRTLIEHWDGSSWAIVKSPNSRVGGYLMSVACTSTVDCVAVGWDNWDPGATLVEQWNGSTWSIVPSPSPGQAGSLSSVACTSATSCIAVGRYNKVDSSYILVERWNGSTWSVSSPAEPNWQSASDRAARRPTANLTVSLVSVLQTAPL